MFQGPVGGRNVETERQAQNKPSRTSTPVEHQLLVAGKKWFASRLGHLLKGQVGGFLNVME